MESILVRAVLAFSIVGTCLLESLAADVPPVAPSGVIERTVWMGLSDGVRLSTDLYLPADGEPAPVVLMRTPYGKTGGGKQGRYFAAQGYAFVVQD